MTFQVETDNTFEIETSAFVSQLRGYSKVEFVCYLTENNVSILQFVEAKTTLVESKEQIAAIINKFKQSLEVVYALRLRHNSEGLPKGYEKLNLEKVIISFCLVVKNSDKEHTSNLCNKIKSELRFYCRCWNIEEKDIKVFNEQSARQHHLIV